MLRKVLLSTAVVAMGVAVTFASGFGLSSPTKATAGQSPCSCCEVCVCETCMCDELGCACDTSGECVCAGACGAICCGTETTEAAAKPSCCAAQGAAKSGCCSKQ